MATCKDCIHYYVCNSKGANCREDISSGSKAKYIDVKELSIILDIMKNPDSEFATDDYIDGFSDGISAVIKELEIMPNEDVVKIVRCKDCKYAYINSFSQLSGVVVCKYLADKSDGILFKLLHSEIRKSVISSKLFFSGLAIFLKL